jgi:hypothetical protein
MKKDLLTQLEDAKEHLETFALVGDWNMVKAWREQIDFITEKIEKEKNTNVLH